MKSTSKLTLAKTRTYAPAIFKAVGLIQALLFASATWAASPQEYLSNAQNFYAKGELKATVIELKNALRADPTLVEGRVLLGQAYLRMGDGASAEKELQRAAKLGAPPGQWAPTLGEAYLLQRKYQEVLDELHTDSAQTADTQAEILAMRGNAYLALGQLDEAENAFKQALVVQPGSTSALLGGARLAMAQKQPLQALQLVEGLLVQSPDHRDALLLQADLNRQIGKPQKSLDSYNRLLELYPQNQHARLGRATMLVATGKIDEALTDLDTIEGVSQIPMAQYLRAVIAFHKQDMKSAKQHLEAVLNSAPDHTQSLLLYGMTNYALGQLETADQYLSRAVKALPNNLQGVKLLAAVKIKLKRPTEAIDLLEPLAENSEDAQIMALLGSAYMMEGDHSKGSELLSQAVEKAPNTAALRTQLALGLLAEGETDEAITELQSAVEMGQDLVQANILLVLTQLREKRYDEALQTAQALEKRMPDMALPYNLSGLTLLAKGELGEAEQKFLKALAVDPGFTTAKMNLARLEMARKDYGNAERHFREILQQSEHNMAALLGLAELAALRGELEVYHRYLNQAYTANPDALKPGLLLSDYYRKTGEPLKALRVSNELNGRFPDNPAVMERLAMAQLASGEASNAARNFDKLIAMQGPSDRLLFLRANAQTASGDYLGARDSYKQAIALAPENDRLKLALGSMELQNQRYGRAIEVAKQVQKSTPDSAAAFQLEARALEAQGQSNAAIDAYKKAHSLQPTATRALRLSNLYRQNNQLEQATAILKDWLIEHPDDVPVNTNLALILHAQGLQKQAIDVYEKVYQSDPNNVIVLNNLAWLYFEVGDKRAVNFAKRAYDAMPQRPEIADTYGWILLRSGQPKQALVVLQQAMVFAPNNAEIAYHVAAAMNEVGRHEEARKILQRMLDKDPSFKDVDEAKALLKQLGG